MNKTAKILATAGTVSAVAIALATPAQASAPQTFDFTFPLCLGVTSADNPFHVTTWSDPGLPLVETQPENQVVVSEFHDAGFYRAIPSLSGDRVRSGRYDDRYEAVATGAVTKDSTGAIATAGHLNEVRRIRLWDGRRFFFTETWIINVDNYDENTTQPTIIDSCNPW
jgi:hypothetical protein